MFCAVLQIPVTTSFSSDELRSSLGLTKTESKLFKLSIPKTMHSLLENKKKILAQCLIVIMLRSHMVTCCSACAPPHHQPSDCVCVSSRSSEDFPPIKTPVWICLPSHRPQLYSVRSRHEQYNTSVALGRSLCNVPFLRRPQRK